MAKARPWGRAFCLSGGTTFQVEATFVWLENHRMWVTYTRRSAILGWLKSLVSKANSNGAEVSVDQQAECQPRRS